MAAVQQKAPVLSLPIIVKGRTKNLDMGDVLRGQGDHTDAPAVRPVVEQLATLFQGPGGLRVKCGEAQAGYAAELPCNLS